MTYRERVLNCLHYRPYDRLPIVHFGYWRETLIKWAEEGHLPMDEAKKWGDGNPTDVVIGKKLGFDSNWSVCFGPHTNLKPAFEREVLEALPNGDRKVRNGDGVVVLENDTATSIPAEIEHLLVDRKSWETHYRHRLQFSEERLTSRKVCTGTEFLPFKEGGLEFLKDNSKREMPIGISCGSLFGNIRNWVGVTGSAYIHADDEELFTEIIDTNAKLSYDMIKLTLETGAKFDFAHFWEDICFKNGPLISPRVFREKVAPHYKRITTLLKQHGVDIVSLDCDGCIDTLVPIWLENGVNTMFPIEVGTWNASIAPWRAKYGRELRGVGGMNKVVFAHDFKAIEAEIERLKPLVELGGFIPCPDHRIPPDAKWDNVRYYCDRMHEIFA